MLKLNFQYAFNNLAESDYQKNLDTALINVRLLNQNKGDNADKGTIMLGWQSWANRISSGEIEEILNLASRLREDCEVIWCLGIGGSYLGIAAMLDSISAASRPQFFFLGTDTDPDYLASVQQLSAGKKLGIIAISKSGTTIEPALALRFGLQALSDRGLDPARYLVAVTDGQKGALHDLAGKLGSDRLVVPDDICGRFSVMTPVGLLPMAVAGIDIESYLAGIREMMPIADSEDPKINLAAQIAAWRFGMMNLGNHVEYQVTESRAFLSQLGWLQQLEAESEGHDTRGVHLIPSLFSRDLHSFGQLIQDGDRHCYEIATKVAPSQVDLTIPALPPEYDLDGLSDLAAAKTSLDKINDLIIPAALAAHFVSGVSSLTLDLPALSPFVLGQYHYLMMKATAISGYLLGVNPFTQPGVQAWKDQLTKRLK